MGFVVVLLTRAKWYILGLSYFGQFAVFKVKNWLYSLWNKLQAPVLLLAEVNPVFVSCFLCLVEAQLVLAYPADANLMSRFCIKKMLLWHWELAAQMLAVKEHSLVDDVTMALRHSVTYLRCWVQAAYTLQLCDATEPRRSAAWITVSGSLFQFQLSLFRLGFSFACWRLLFMPAIQKSILLTVWSTNQICVYTVLIQGLRSGHCCLAPLVLLRLVIEQADDTALVRVTHTVDHLFILSSACRQVWFFCCCFLA